MRKTIIMAILFTIFISKANASEITGSISTNPNNFGTSAKEKVNNIKAPYGYLADSGIASAGKAFLLATNTLAKVKSDKAIVVLGFSQYPDNTLLRGANKKIYLLQNGYKKYISNLFELRKYAGQSIFDVQDNILAKYQERNYLDGDLLRLRGGQKIFVILDGHLKHILNLEELRSNFFGQEIFNIGQEEMILYKN